jgi:hypothetical protein
MALIDLRGLTDTALIEHLRDLRLRIALLGLQLSQSGIGEGEP